MIRLFVKGNKTDTELALAKHNLTMFGNVHSHIHEFNETVVLIDDRFIDRVRNWFNEHSKFVVGGYELGTLLHYTAQTKKQKPSNRKG